MTTGIDRDSDSGRAWATHVLQVPAQASTAEMRKAFLARLREADFVPPRRWIEAFCALADKQSHAVPVDEAYGSPALGGALREAVEDYAQAFWSLTVEDRRQRWQRLIDTCADFPALLVRLRQLHFGLYVEPVTLASCPERAQQLDQRVLDLFILRRAERALERQKLLQAWESERWDWQVAAQQLRQTHPEVAALDQPLVSLIASWSSRHVKVRRARKAWARAQAPRAGVGGSRRIAWYGWVAMVVGGALGLVLAISDSNSPKPLNGPAESPRRYEETLKQIRKHNKEANKNTDWKDLLLPGRPEEAPRRQHGFRGSKPAPLQKQPTPKPKPPDQPAQPSKTP